MWEQVACGLQIEMARSAAKFLASQLIVRVEHERKQILAQLPIESMSNPFAKQMFVVRAAEINIVHNSEMLKSTPI